MLNGLFVALLFPASPAPAPLTRGEPTAQQPQQDAEFDRRRKDAGNDVDKLWDVYKWCKEQKKDDKGRSVCRQILKIDPNFEDANLALGYVKYDNKWFPSQKKIEEYKKEQAAKEAKEAEKDGLVDYKGKRVAPEDVPFLEKGLVKDDEGKWVDAEELKRKQEGWILQDLEWVPPADKAHIDKGLWKCGDKWLTLDEANAFHRDLYKWWRIPAEHYWLYTTQDRAVALEKYKPTLDHAWDDLIKVVGFEPAKKPIVVLLRDKEQYSQFAAGDDGEDFPDTDGRGLSSWSNAYFSENAVYPLGGEPMLAGIGFWDPNEKDGDKWGIHAARRALGLAFADALDPSVKALEKWKKTKKYERDYLQEFHDEKRIPEWFRQGVASYVERYYIDVTVAVGGKTRWAREWSVENIVNKGGLRSLKQLMDPKFMLKTGDDAPKVTNELGLMIAFAVDGGCAPVTEKFKVVQEALKTNKNKKEIGADLQALADEIMKQETELRKFAGL